MSTLLETFASINSSSFVLPGMASQEHLDEIGHLLDNLERVEIYMESPQCTRDEYDDCKLERDSLVDRIHLMCEDV